ncbi:MAG: sigma-70 family RNA polymerase sigma factor [Firmicutes bacterium]|nr:sigma-70 family RNA polymerase sigma factor [Bacillota bacterium]
MQNDQTVQLIRERNEKGMQSLLKHYGPLIRYVAEPILENASDCEELLQDVALRVWERIDRYDEAKARFSTWVTTITRNAALDKLKRRCETESYEELSDQIPAESGGPEAEAIKKDAQAAVRAALDKLSDSDRALAYRRYWYMQSISRIAAETGLTERAVEGRLYRIRVKLAEMLKGYYHE